jgi:hypothetical protein
MSWANQNPPGLTRARPRPRPHLGFFGDALPSGRGHASATSGYREDDESGCHKRYPDFQIPPFFSLKTRNHKKFDLKTAVY